MSKPGKLFIYLISFVAISLWGLSYIWSDRILSMGIPVEYFVPIRILVAGVLLLIANLCCGYSIRLHKEDALPFLLLALCEPFIYFFCETYGIQLTESPTISALVIATTPIFAAIAGILFFKERVSWLNVIGILVCLGGLLLVTHARTSTGRYFIYGILVLLIAVFAEVSHVSFTKSLSDRYAPSVIVMYQFLFGTVYFLPLFLTRGLEHFDPALYLSMDFIKPLLALAVLCSSLAFSLMATSIKHLGVAKSSIFLAMIPVATALFGFILGDERLCGLQWVGLTIACTGLILTQIASKKKA